MWVCSVAVHALPCTEFCPAWSDCCFPVAVSLCSSFFQSLCVLGYCVLPLTVAMLVCRLVLLAGAGTISFIIRLIVVGAMFGWSTLGESFTCALRGSVLGELDPCSFPWAKPRDALV